MKLLAILLILLPCFVNSANILVLEALPSPSHHIWIRTITTALAAAGHNVTSLSTDIEEKTPENLHYLHLDKIYDVLYNPEDEDFEMEMDFFEMGEMNPYIQLIMFYSFQDATIKGCTKSTGFRQLLAYPDDFKFDLVIHDFLAGGIMLPFATKFNNPPIVALTAFFSAEFTASFTGGTLNTAYVPYLINSGADLTSFLGRTNNFILTHLDYFLREYYLAPLSNRLLSQEFPWDVDIRELMSQSKIVLLNKHPGLDVLEPIMPNVISVGGLQIQRNDGLPEDLQEVMDNAKNGAILFSLGTNVKSETLGDARQIEIVEAFRALPQYTFIWKFETDSLPVEVPSNVLIRKFVPQSDLLAHPNMKLFISHCGLLSTQESVWYGVPILGLPVMVDQFQNLELSIKTGVAEKGDIKNIERNSFRKSIEKMMNDPKYRENAKIRSDVFRDQKETPLERAIWWIEYVLRHPNMTHMKSPSMDLYLVQRQSYDVLAFLFVIILVTFHVFLKISCCICRSCSKKKSRKPKSANILVLEAVPSPSHHIWIRTITTTLAAAGHNVTSLSTDIEEETPDNLHYLHLNKVYDVMYNQSNEDFDMDWDFIAMGKINPFLQIFLFSDFSEIILKGSFQSTGFRQLLAYPSDYKFDLVIYDFFAFGILLPFAQRFGDPPIVALTAFYSVEFSASLVGGTLSPSHVPYLVNSEGDLTTFSGRFSNFLLTHLDYFVKEYYIFPRLNTMMKREFPWAKDIRELHALAKIVLLNKHHGLDVIEQAFPNVISVGGLQIARNKGLSKDFQEIMDNSENGVILFSLGTNMKSEMLGDARQIEILEAFRALPQYKILWKFETDSLPIEVPSNVIIRKWIPQSDLLAHPNMKLFISHCGLLSTQEAAWYGVPILGLPVFGDQWQNIKLSTDHGVGEQGDLANIERQSFKNLIEKMLTDPKYQNNAKIRSEMFQDQKESPLERAVWWIEYVLRHPNMTHMRSSSIDLGMMQRQSWDVLAVLFTVVVIIIILFFKIFCCIYRTCSEKRQKKIKKE
ncbi:uncharacterized protein LOC132259181 [Phlebotomus argentipes]|uniref:uncharacterized protein LOC132259181 n=1 Tax=Phlebotomus argentipes TaxID=94469 RepID=UPI002892CA69|nr:uncharacterized protein LOC132259181 [Phlebotomus argentipes]